MKHEIIRVKEDDPKRCYATNRLGQCTFQQIEGSNFCPCHAGGAGKKQEKVMRNYRLEKYKQRHEDFLNSDGHKSLHEEVAMLRILIEERMLSIQTPFDLIGSSGPISELILKVEKLVVSAHNLDIQTKNTVDQATLVTLAAGIVEIIKAYVPEEDKCIAISEDIQGLLISL